MRYIAQQNTSYSTTDWTNVAFWKEADGAAISGAPVEGDYVHANGKTVTIDVENSFGTLLTSAYTGTVNNSVGGGGFYKTANGTHTGDCRAGTTNCLTISAATVIVNGDVYGSTTNDGRSGLVLSGAGEVTINGSAYGGTPYNTACGAALTGGGVLNVTDVYGRTSYGVRNTGTGTLNITNIYAGSAINNMGGYNGSTGTVNITNAYGGLAAGTIGFVNSGNGVCNVVNAYGGTTTTSAGVANSAAGTITVQNSYGGTEFVGGVINSSNGLVICVTSVAFPPPVGSYVEGTLPLWIGSNLNTNTPAGGYGVGNAANGACYVEQVFYGRFGNSPTYGNVKFGKCVGTTSSHVVTVQNPVVQAPKAESNIWSNPSTMVDMVEQTEEGLVPSASDVRSEVKYGSLQAYTGTLAVPSVSNVSLNVPVDDTVGQGIITVSDLRPLLTR